MSKIERSQDKLVSKVNQEYAKVAGRLGLGFSDMGFESIGPFTGGTFGRINHVFTSPSTPDIYTDSNIITFTAHGLAAAVLSEPLKCYCGVFVDKPSPASIYVKQIREGFRKKPIWVPYDKNTKASDVYKSRKNWNGLVDALNKDNELTKLMGKLRVENNIHGIDQNLTVGRGKSLPVRVNDTENNHGSVCMIIPMGNRTLIASQHVTQNPKDIEPALKAIQIIASIVENYGYDQPTTGPMISDYADDLLKIMPSEQPEPALTPPPPPVQSTGIKCPSCGHQNPETQKFCGECGTKLTPEKNVCSQCGAEIPEGNKFCGECGAPLEAPAPVAPVATVAAAAPQLDMSDPLEKLISEIEGGKDAQWTIRYQTTEQEYEGKLWNIANEGYFTDMDKLLKLGEKIGQTARYQLYNNIKYVKAPNGQALTGGFMNLAAFFNNFAAESVRSKNLQVLLLPRDDNPAETRVRLIASSDKDMSPEKLDEMLDVLLNKHGHVKEFYLWGIME